MKKMTIPALVLGIAMFTACGPSAEEKAAEAQRIQDSIAEVERIKAEEMMAIQIKAMEDSLALVEAARIAAEEAAAAAKPGTKPKPKAVEPAKPAEPPKNIKDAVGGSKTDTTSKPKNIKDAMKK